VVKFVALVFVLTMDKQNAINFQLLGGIWILQTFPAIVFGLYTRWFHRWALIAGWAVGMLYGTVAAYNVVKPTLGGGTQHFAGSVALIPVLAQLGYIALTAFTINVIVATVATFVLRALKTPAGTDTTIKGDYFADEGDPRVKPLDEPIHLVTPSV
jgi:solute:Na+ symporter, SSS family